MSIDYNFSDNNLFQNKCSKKKLFRTNVIFTHTFVQSQSSTKLQAYLNVARGLQCIEKYIRFMSPNNILFRVSKFKIISNLVAQTYSIRFILIIILDLDTPIKKIFNFVYLSDKASLPIHLTKFQPIKNRLNQKSINFALKL